MSNIISIYGSHDASVTFLDSNNKLNPFIAVLDMDLLSKNIIEFGLNSWRGDLYEDLLK